MNTDKPDAAPETYPSAERLGAAVQDTARKIGEQASEVGSQVYKQATEAGRYAGKQLEEQPVAAAVMAGVLGLMIGYLLGRGTAPEPSFRDYARDAVPPRFRPRW